MEVLSQLMDSQKEAGKMMYFKDHSYGLVQNISLEAFHYLQLRQYGQHRHDPSPLFAEYTSHQVPGLLHEHEFDMGTMNKIFASKWLNDKQLVFGTKCNQVSSIEYIL